MFDSCSAVAKCGASKSTCWNRCDRRLIACWWQAFSFAIQESDFESCFESWTLIQKRPESSQYLPGLPHKLRTNTNLFWFSLCFLIFLGPGVLGPYNLVTRVQCQCLSDVHRLGTNGDLRVPRNACSFGDRKRAILQTRLDDLLQVRGELSEIDFGPELLLGIGLVPKDSIGPVIFSW